MITIDDLRNTVEAAKKSGLISKENYWVYISLQESACYASQKEKPAPGFIGYFCEDETRLNGIHTIAERKAKRCRMH